MPHKRNPKTSEHIEGIYTLVKDDYSKALDTLNSDHSRDLTGSCVMRTLPAIVVYVAHQLECLLETDGGGETLIERVCFNTLRAKERVHFEGSSALAEVMYCGLARAGYAGNAHRLVSEKVLPFFGCGAWQALEYIAWREQDPALYAALKMFPQKAKELLQLNYAENYLGEAEQIASIVAARAVGFVASYQ